MLDEYVKCMISSSAVKLVVQRICATFSCNWAKNGKGTKFGKNEADTIQINNQLGAFRKCQNFR